MDPTYNIENLQPYIKQNKDELLKGIVLKGKTIDRMSLRQGIKTREAVHYFDLPVTFQDGRVCKFTAAGNAVELSDRIIETGLIKIQDELCPNDLLGSYAEALVKIGANENELPFEEYIAEWLVNKVQQLLEVAVWQGDTDSENDNLNKFDGLLKLAGAEDSTIHATVPAGSSAYALIKAVYMAMPEEVLSEPSVAASAAIHVSPALFRAFMQDLVAKNLFHYNPGDKELDEIAFPGSDVKIVKTLGLRGIDPVVYASFDKNLFYGCDMKSNAEELRIWFSEDDQIFKYSIKFNAGVQTAFPDMVVIGYYSGAVVPVTSIELNKTATSIALGATETLEATVAPATATDPSVTWESNDEEVATVLEGVVTPVAAGSCVIIAKAGDKIATCAVTVPAPEEPGE